MDIGLVKEFFSRNVAVAWRQRWRRYDGGGCDEPYVVRWMAAMRHGSYLPCRDEFAPICGRKRGAAPAQETYSTFVLPALPGDITSKDLGSTASAFSAGDGLGSPRGRGHARGERWRRHARSTCLQTGPRCPCERVEQGVAATGFADVPVCPPSAVWARRRMLLRDDDLP